MPIILSVAEETPQHVMTQDRVMEFAEELFSETFRDIKRLLPVFKNGQIEKRHFAKDIDWFKTDHSLEERNDAYIETSVELGTKAIQKCLGSEDFLAKHIPYEDIDAIITISSSGLATPSLEARIMNILPFSRSTKRIPIWGLGCAGGASGLSRAFEYCRAFPKGKVLVLSVELCSLTFQRNDRSKSNLVGTSLFADGVACALVCGDDSNYQEYQKLDAYPTIVDTNSALMENSLDVMGWDIKDEGLYVVFSRDIPTIVEGWLQPIVLSFLQSNGLAMNDVHYFVAHPGGKKVLEAYCKALELEKEKTNISLDVLREFGNMSSATILYVLRRFMEAGERDRLGLAAAMGPGFSSELLLLRWQ